MSLPPQVDNYAFVSYVSPYLLGISNTRMFPSMVSAQPNTSPCSHAHVTQHPWDHCLGSYAHPIFQIISYNIPLLPNQSAFCDVVKTELLGVQGRRAG